MKVLLFSDLHLDAPFAWLGAQPQAARKRRQALRDTLGRIVQLAVAAHVDALFCAGDLYEHERYSPDTAAFLRKTFADLHPLPVYLAPGNHDWYGPESLYHQVPWTDNVHLFREDHLTPLSLTDGLTLWGSAHCAPANTNGFLDGFRVDRDGVHLALFHGSEQGWLSAQESGKVPHAPFRGEQIAAAGLHHAFLGHFHRPRDGERFTYPGNPDPLTFGEDGDRGAVIAVVAPDGTVSRERHRVAVTRASDLSVDVTGCTSQQDVRERVVACVQGLDGVARVTLTGEIDVDVDLRLHDLLDVAPWLDALVVRLSAVRAAYDFSTIAEEQTVRGWFVRDVQSAELPEDERRRILVTGLRALDGRDDLEVL